MTNFTFHPGIAGLFHQLPPRYISPSSVFPLPVENMSNWFKIFYAHNNENHMSYIKGDYAKAFIWIRFCMQFHALADILCLWACAAPCTDSFSPVLCPRQFLSSLHMGTRFRRCVEGASESPLLNFCHQRDRRAGIFSQSVMKFAASLCTPVTPAKDDIFQFLKIFLTSLSISLQTHKIVLPGT